MDSIEEYIFLIGKDDRGFEEYIPIYRRVGQIDESYICNLFLNEYSLRQVALDFVQKYAVDVELSEVQLDYTVELELI